MDGSQPDLLFVLLLALLPAAGSIAGVLLAEWKQPPDWLTGAALHAAAGIATSVAAIELLPRALERTEAWHLAIAVMGGALASVALMRTTAWAKKKLATGKRRLAVWTVYTAISVDLLSDGLTTGTGAAVSSSLGLLLALSQVVANIPGGFAVTANFRKEEVPRRRRLIAAAFYPITPIVGALVGFFALRSAAPSTIGLALAFFAGLLLLATVEDLVPEADQPGTPRRVSSPAYAGGFVLFMLMAVYVDG